MKQLGDRSLDPKGIEDLPADECFEISMRHVIRYACVYVVTLLDWTPKHLSGMWHGL